MARIDRLAQRRQLRRAAEQALIAAFPQPSDSAPVPDIAAPTAHTNGNSEKDFSREPSIDGPHDKDPHDDWHDPDETPPLGIPLPTAGEIYTTPIDSDVTELSELRSGRWYHSKRGAIGVVAAAVLAIAVTGVLLVVRDGQSGPEESSTDSPIASTTAVRPPTSAAPAPSATAAPPAPPPPPSAAPSNPAPVITQPYNPPGETDSAEPNMPEIGVTRTPATRAPFSASPSPFPPPQYNQGDGRRAPRCCGF